MLCDLRESVDGLEKPPPCLSAVLDPVGVRVGGIEDLLELSDLMVVAGL